MKKHVGILGYVIAAVLLTLLLLSRCDPYHVIAADGIVYVINARSGNCTAMFAEPGVNEFYVTKRSLTFR
jgi:hypothetical protein